jgi:hypothetical protein
VAGQAGEATRLLWRGAQQAQPPLWSRIGEAPAAGVGLAPAARRGADISRGEGAAQAGQGVGRSDSAIERQALNGPHSSHAYS